MTINQQLDAIHRHLANHRTKVHEMIKTNHMTADPIDIVSEVHLEIAINMKER